MIGYLRGKLMAQNPPHLVIEVNGVGYELEASTHTFSCLPNIEEFVVLHTHFVVREDAQLLFAFHDLAERSLFRSLIKVSGIGPRLALSILSAVKPSHFAQCVLEKNAARLKDIPGIGKKMAERLIIEMRDKLAEWHFLGDDTPTNAILIQRPASQDALGALLALGYKSHEASRVIARIERENEAMNTETLIRLALKELTRG